MGEKKSKAKAAGMKSALVCQEEVLVTSFGRGNRAIPEKRIDGERVLELQEKSKFDLAVAGRVYKVGNAHVEEVMCNNPMYQPVIGQDLLREKPKLERLFFSAEYPGDNIHIQIIYNILDIKKIMSVYANNIIFSLNNLKHEEEGEREKDYLGYLFTGNSYRTLKSSQDPIVKKAYENFQKCI